MLPVDFFVWLCLNMSSTCAYVNQYVNQSINQSINQDCLNASANKISHWRARQRMDEIKKENEMIINVQLNQDV